MRRSLDIVESTDIWKRPQMAMMQRELDNARVNDHWPWCMHMLSSSERRHGIGMQLTARSASKCQLQDTFLHSVI